MTVTSSCCPYFRLQPEVKTHCSLVSPAMSVQWLVQGAPCCPPPPHHHPYPGFCHEMLWTGHLLLCTQHVPTLLLCWKFFPLLFCKMPSPILTFFPSLNSSMAQSYLERTELIPVSMAHLSGELHLTTACFLGGTSTASLTPHLLIVIPNPTPCGFPTPRRPKMAGETLHLERMTHEPSSRCCAVSLLKQRPLS